MNGVAAMTASGGRGRAGLLWTECWYLAATVVAAVVAVDPLGWGLASEAIFKHAALALSLPALALTLAGGRLGSRERAEAAIGPVAALLWPLLALALFALCGALYARLFGGIQNSFLNVGLYMLTACTAAVMVMRSGAPVALARAHLRIVLVAALVMGAYLIANYRVRQVYHEQIFLVIPMATLFFARAKQGVLRWAGCLFFLAMAWLSAKYTSYLIGALTVAWLALAVAIPRVAASGRLRRAMLVYWTCAIGGAAALGFMMLGMHGAFDLPTGNVEYRSHTYLAAWNRFLDSPLWGTLFAVEAVEKFTLYTVGVSRNLLATHSDVLDLLANGGLLGVALWLYGLWRIARAAHASLLRPGLLGREWAPVAHTLAVMSLAGVITYAFNPILLQPALAYLLWTSLGLLAGLALRMKEVEPEPGRAGSPAAAARPLQGRYGAVAADTGARRP